MSDAVIVYVLTRYLADKDYIQYENTFGYGSDAEKYANKHRKQTDNLQFVFEHRIDVAQDGDDQWYIDAVFIENPTKPIWTSKEIQ